MSIFEAISLIILFSLLGAAVGGFVVWKSRSVGSPIHRRLARHFAPVSLEQLTLTHRRFPAGIRVDVHGAIEVFLAESRDIDAVGIKNEHSFFGMDFANLLNPESVSLDRKSVV